MNTLSTPGPWTVRKRATDGYAVETSAGPVAFIYEAPGKHKTLAEEICTMRGNVNLIAAAPDMLKALVVDRLVARYEDPWTSDHESVVAQMHELGFESAGYENELAEEFAARLKAAAINKATDEPL